MTALIAPFRPLRFKIEPGADAGVVWAPPYDVITDEDAAELRSRHPRNIVRITNPAQTSTDPYASAARTLRDWVAEGWLARDAQSGVYVHRHRFESGGNAYERAGVWALLGLEEFGAGAVVPHERTMTGPKADRLALMRACQAQLSPIFFICSDPQARLREFMEESARDEATEGAEFPSGIRHQIWRVVNRRAVERLSAIVRDQVLLIADGHHRYETALDYRDELIAGGAARTGRGSHEFVLAYIVPETDPGLLLLPTHRVMRGASLPWISAVLKTTDRFEILRLDERGVEAAMRGLAEERGRPSFVLVARGEEGGWLLRLRKPTETTVISSVALHDVFLRDGAGLTEEEQIQRISYVKDPSKALSNVRTGAAEAVFLLAAPEVRQVRTAAVAGERLPPKTTYFWPKVPTGIAIHPIDPAEMIEYLSGDVSEG
jgi:uncharacterized protein (DUF1015 family)